MLITNILTNKTQFMTNTKHLHVSSPGCHPQGAFHIEGIQSQKLQSGYCIAVTGMIKILKFQNTQN